MNNQASSNWNVYTLTFFKTHFCFFLISQKNWKSTKRKINQFTHKKYSWVMMSVTENIQHIISKWQNSGWPGKRIQKWQLRLLVGPHGSHTHTTLTYSFQYICPGIKTIFNKISFFVHYSAQYKRRNVTKDIL